MNERIRELAKWAGYNGHYATEEFDVDEFAELIVKECAEICYNRDYTCGSAYGDAIAEHFGL